MNVPGERERCLIVFSLRSSDGQQLPSVSVMRSQEGTRDSTNCKLEAGEVHNPM